MNVEQYQNLDSNRGGESGLLLPAFNSCIQGVFSMQLPDSHVEAT